VTTFQFADDTPGTGSLNAGQREVMSTLQLSARRYSSQMLGMDYGCARRLLTSFPESLFCIKLEIYSVTARRSLSVRFRRRPLTA